MKLITDGPKALPGNCYVCRVADRKKFIDLESDVDFYGAMYLCDLCIIEMAQKLGMVSEEQASNLNFAMMDARENIEVLKEEIKALKGVLDGYDDVRTYLDSPSLFSDSNLGYEPGEEGAGAEAREGEGELEKREVGPLTPVDDEGMDDLRSSEPGAVKFEL